MQNEACIKQGSEKEPFRQQLIDAKQEVKFFCNLPEFDADERNAIMAILTAAEEQRMSPKAFIQAAAAVAALNDLKNAVFSVGHAVNELNEREDGAQLYQNVKKYVTKRAEVLGFQKSLNPSGWDILED